MRGFSEMHELLAMYEQYITLTTSREASYRYCYSLENFIYRFPDKEHPQDFIRADIEDYRIQRLRENISPSVINYEVGRVSAFWNWMIDLGKASWNPASKSKKLKVIEPIRKSWSLPEQQQLQKGCYTWQDRVLIALLLTTGLRSATLVKLERSDIDFDNGCLRIPAEKMKAGRGHEMPLPAWVVELLQDVPEGLVFAGYAKDSRGIWYRLGCITRRAGVTLSGARVGRRSFATTLLRSGSDLSLVKDLMGHRNISTTSRYLTPADTKTARDAVERLPVLKEICESSSPANSRA